MTLRCLLLQSGEGMTAEKMQTQFLHNAAEVRRSRRTLLLASPSGVMRV